MVIYSEQVVGFKSTSFAVSVSRPESAAGQTVWMSK